MTDNRVSEVLYGVSFVIHLCSCFYIANTEPISWLVGVAMYLLSMYENIGFNWSREVAYLLCAGMIFGIVLNAIRRAAEGIILGWPRFKYHNKHTFYRFWLRCIFWVSVVFLGLGAYGSNDSRNFEKLHALDAGYAFGGAMDVLSIAIFSFLFGAVVNVIDDAISATFSSRGICD
ncbi:MAG: hypothetical protein LBU53_05365 [Zoogloeaceae bacterium]|jgi:hypothetical protein|nr:hypothetical protein [Zoogloeaceae bacterium]